MFPTLFVPPALFALPLFSTSGSNATIDPLLIVPFAVGVAGLVAIALLVRNSPQPSAKPLPVLRTAERPVGKARTAA
jgi:hypothetical protein